MGKKNTKKAKKHDLSDHVLFAINASALGPDDLPRLAQFLEALAQALIQNRLIVRRGSVLGVTGLVVGMHMPEDYLAIPICFVVDEDAPGFEYEPENAQ